MWWLVIGGVLIALAAYLLLRSKGPAGLPNQIEHLPTYYDTNLPWWLAWLRKKGSAQRSKLAGELHSEQHALTQILAHQSVLIQTQSENEYMPQQMHDVHELADEMHKLTVTVVRGAQDKRVDLLTYSEIRKKEEFERLELERRWVEIEQDLKAGFIYAQKERQYLQLFQDYLFGLYEDRKRIESGNEPAKNDKLKFLNGYIRGMEKDFRGQQKRLLQAPTRKNLPAGDPDTERE